MITFDLNDIEWSPAGFGTIKYAIVYAQQPRWWWCKYLPKRWEWAWPHRPICFYDNAAVGAFLGIRR